MTFTATTPAKYVAYYRVSTSAQGASGLGLEAQATAVRQFAGGSAIVREFTDIESGKHDDRPQLANALAECRRRRAVLVIAKLDRLSRSVSFISKLMDSGVEFVACDMPQANKFTIHIMAAVAEQEREAISKRTRVALAAAKARGVQLGGSYRWNEADYAKGRAASAASRKAAAAARARDVLPVIEELRAEGRVTLAQIAAGLSGRGIVAARGGNWTPWAVSKVISKESE